IHHRQQILLSYCTFILLTFLSRHACTCIPLACHRTCSPPVSTIYSPFNALARAHARPFFPHARAARLIGCVCMLGIHPVRSLAYRPTLLPARPSSRPWP
ncbi:uncharacterized protein C8Q71DRAFT_788831, partial [Rhodofomes roseus]